MVPLLKENEFLLYSGGKSLSADYVNFIIFFIKFKVWWSWRCYKVLDRGLRLMFRYQYVSWCLKWFWTHWLMGIVIS